MENLKKLFKELDSFEKELTLLSLVLKKIEEENIVLHYSEEFILELKNIAKSFDYLKSLNVNIFNLLIDTFDRDYSEKAKLLLNIKKEILSCYSEEDLSFLRLNHLNLTKFFQKNKNLLSFYQENKFISFKDLSKLNKKDVNNFFILKKEYELNYLKTLKFNIFHKEFKSTILKDSIYNKPVYLGLKHLQQKDNLIYMEGPYFSQKAPCPKCNSKIIHLLEGISKDGSIYICSNLNCSFFITGNFFIKRGYQDLINFFKIKDSFEEKRNSSHNRIFHTLSCIKFQDNLIDIVADDFTFFYKYQIEENSIGFRLDRIKHKDKILYLDLFYKKRHSIYNFLDYILNFD